MPAAKGADRLRFLHVDLGDMRSVRRAGEEFMEKEKRLDVLGMSRFFNQFAFCEVVLRRFKVHNAGRMFSPYEISKDGVELGIAVKYEFLHNVALRTLHKLTVRVGTASHLSVSVLTETLMPILKSTASEPNSDVRVVVVSLTSSLLSPV